MKILEENLEEISSVALLSPACIHILTVVASIVSTHSLTFSLKLDAKCSDFWQAKQVLKVLEDKQVILIMQVMVHAEESGSSFDIHAIPGVYILPI